MTVIYPSNEINKSFISIYNNLLFSFSLSYYYFCWLLTSIKWISISKQLLSFCLWT